MFTLQCVTERLSLGKEYAMSASASFIEHFSDVTEPRRGEPVYPLQNILFISVCAVICGADDFVAIAKFGRTKKDWLAKHLDLSAGIPSHDRFNAILAQIRPAEFEKCLLNWITSLQEISGGQIIAIDGKSVAAMTRLVASLRFTWTVHG